MCGVGGGGGGGADDKFVILLVKKGYWARQFIPNCLSLPSCNCGYLALIRQCLELVRYMLPAALEYPSGD